MSKLMIWKDGLQTTQDDEHKNIIWMDRTWLKGDYLDKKSDLEEQSEKHADPKVIRLVNKVRTTKYHDFHIPSNFIYTIPDHDKRMVGRLLVYPGYDEKKKSCD
jgi:hypothetical protein